MKNKMQNEKLKDLLATVYQSVISFDEDRWIKPDRISSFKYIHPHHSESTFEGVGIVKYSFEIRKNDMQFKFHVDICKKEETSFWGNESDKYLTKIIISNDNSYSSRDLESLYFISWFDDSKSVQKDIFDFLEKRNKYFSEKELNDKYTNYITQLKKTVSKAATRDDRIDGILEDK
jgi:hypothetical protein